MKNSSRFILLLLLIFLFSQPPTILAEGSTSSKEPMVYDTMKKEEGKASKPSPEVVEGSSIKLIPSLMKFLFSFILVIGLLILLLRYLAKRNQALTANGPVLPLGGYPLGNNKSIQVVMIGQTIYIVGVGDDISLIRAIPPGEEYQHLLESYENQGESSSWLSNDSRMAWTSVFEKHLKKMIKTNREE
ncbi:flagellar biosynthetic protein FliO [Pseudoneobacillus sp. C159]